MALAGVKGWKTKTTSGDEYAGLIVGMAFGSAPFASSCQSFNDRQWTDVSTSVRYVHAMKGRSNDLDVFGPNTCELVLDNRRRLYDPTATTNALAGKILPGTPIKVEMRQPGSTAVNRVYSGYVEAFKLRYPGKKDAVLDVDCADGLKFLGLSNLNGTTIAGARTDLMVSDILDVTGWPATTGWRTLSTGYTTGADYPAIHAPALEMLRTVADVENGAFFVNTQGQARFASRRFWVDSNKEVKAIFSDAEPHIHYSDIHIAYDDSQLYNRVVIGSLSTLSPSTASRPASIATFGERTMTRLKLPVASTADADEIAHWLATRYGEPSVRISRIECKPRSSTKIWDLYNDTGGIHLGSKVVVNRHPPGGGRIRQVCHTEGEEHTIDVQQDDWTYSLDLSPAERQPY